MTDCIQGSFAFPACRKRSVVADFAGGDVSSNGGVLLLRAADRRLGLMAAAARLLPDPRDRGRCRHSALDQLRQRVYALALGDEDLNDHGALRHDLALQTAVERISPLASAPTLCRFEHWADRATAIALNALLVEQFIASFRTAPAELVLDFDATDDPVHGRQEGRFFHGFYDQYCFLPLYVFCGDQLLISYLRPSNIDAAKHAWAILALLVKRLRRAWPGVRIIFRGDRGFCRHRMLGWCERHAVGYITGLARNARLNDLAAPCIQDAAAGFAEMREKQRHFGEFRYAARTWRAERRVIARIEHDHHGSNPRYVVTNLGGEPRALYEDLYCARGEMENRMYGRLPGRKRFLRRTGVDGQLLPCIRPSVRPQGLLASMRFAGRLPTIKSSWRLCGSPGFCRPTVRPSCHRVEDRPRSSWKLATPPILGVMDCSLAFVLRTDQAVAR